MRPLVGTGLKMHLTSSELAEYLDTLRPLVGDVRSCDLFVLPSFTSIWVARDLLADTNIAWGAQDVSREEAGAHTGDVSARMLADLGCTYVEVGHSERRRDHGETDELVAAKVAQVVRNGMTPIVCVGEPTRRSAASSLDHVREQVERDLAGISAADRARVVIAYEPVWAIGLGATPASPDHVAAVHSGVHTFLCSPGGGGIDARVIYGGSVDPASAVPLLAMDGVDGLFIGRAALDPAWFASIALAAEARANPDPPA
jgi:triosephosphate isomerase